VSLLILSYFIAQKINSNKKVGKTIETSTKLTIVISYGQELSEKAFLTSNLKLESLVKNVFLHNSQYPCLSSIVTLWPNKRPKYPDAKFQCQTSWIANWYLQ
jgi:hypothetical protein